MRKAIIRKIIMTIGVAMLLVTGVYAKGLEFSNEEGILSTPESEFPEDGERFFTTITFPVYGSSESYEGQVIVRDEEIILDGQGKRVFENGDIIEGTFENGFIVKGKITYEEGGFYEGELIRNFPSGPGKLVHPNGDIEEGNYEEGNLFGIGKYEYADGKVYQGEFCYGMYNGQGKMTYPDGKVEEGTFKHGVFLGDVTMPVEIWYEKYIDEIPSSLYITPIHEEDTMLVPLRDVGQLLMARVDWEESSQTITITHEKTEIKLVIGKKIALVNGEEKELLLAPRLVDGVTMVPLRFISENFNSNVEWIPKYHLIKIISKNMSYAFEGED